MAGAVTATFCSTSALGILAKLSNCDGIASFSLLRSLREIPRSPQELAMLIPIRDSRWMIDVGWPVTTASPLLWKTPL